VLGGSPDEPRVGVARELLLVLDCLFQVPAGELVELDQVGCVLLERCGETLVQGVLLSFEWFIGAVG